MTSLHEFRAMRDDGDDDVGALSTAEHTVLWHGEAGHHLPYVICRRHSSG